MSVSGLGQSTVRPATAPNSPKRITAPTFGAQTIAPSETPKAETAPVSLESLFQQFLKVLETLFNEVKGLLYHLKDTLTEALKDTKAPKETAPTVPATAVGQAAKQASAVADEPEIPQDVQTSSESILSKHTNTPPIQFKSASEGASEPEMPPPALDKPSAFKSPAEKTKPVQNDREDLVEDTPETSSSSNSEQDIAEKAPHNTPFIPVTQPASNIAENIPSPPKAIETADDATATLDTPQHLTPKTAESNTASVDAAPLKATEPEIQADFEALSHNLLAADKNLREKFAAFQERQAFLPKKGRIERFQDHFKRAALRRPGEVEQAAANIVTTFDENQTDLDEINLIARSASYHALLQPEQRDTLINKMSGFTEKTRQNIGTIQDYDRKQQTLFRMPLWSLSRTNVRTIHQLDRALENYKNASEQLLDA
jgi:hypothetical protein